MPAFEPNELYSYTEDGAGGEETGKPKAREKEHKNWQMGTSRSSLWQRAKTIGKFSPEDIVDTYNRTKTGAQCMRIKMIKSEMCAREAGRSLETASVELCADDTGSHGQIRHRTPTVSPTVAPSRRTMHTEHLAVIRHPIGSAFCHK